MKNKLRKHLSAERRDLWDGSKIYQFWSLSVDRLKHKLKLYTPKRQKDEEQAERSIEMEM